MEQHLSLSVREDAHRLAVDRKTPQESGAALKKRNGREAIASPELDMYPPVPELQPHQVSVAETRGRKLKLLHKFVFARHLNPQLGPN